MVSVTDSVGEKGSRLLDEAAQLCDMLRMAHSTAHRMQQDLHAESYDKVSEIADRLHDLRVACNRLFDEVAHQVGEMEAGGHHSDRSSGAQE